MRTLAIIIDSSIAAKWFFSEENSDIAEKIKDDFESGIISIAVPTVFYYEVNNLLKTATKRLRLNVKNAQNVYEAFLKLSFIAYHSEDLMKNTLGKAIEFDLSSYDASYVALADHLQIPFFTADQKLLNKAKSKYLFALQTYAQKLES